MTHNTSRVAQGSTLFGTWYIDRDDVSKRYTIAFQASRLARGFNVTSDAQTRSTMTEALDCAHEMVRVARETFTAKAIERNAKSALYFVTLT